MVNPVSIIFSIVDIHYSIFFGVRSSILLTGTGNDNYGIHNFGIDSGHHTYFFLVGCSMSHYLGVTTMLDT
jgi:hypothetical protein